MIREVLVKFLLPDIRLHDAVCDMVHRVKILVRDTAPAVHGDRSKRVTAREAGILIDLRPLAGKLRGTDQVDLFVRKALQRVIPAVTLHILDLPVHIVAECLQVLHIHAAVGAVLIFFVVALHWKESDLHRAFLRAVHARYADASCHTDTDHDQRDSHQQTCPDVPSFSTLIVHRYNPHCPKELSANILHRHAHGICEHFLTRRQPVPPIAFVYIIA